MDFSTIVKQARIDWDIRQKELAQALNVSYVTINRWGNGKIEPNRLAKAAFFLFVRRKV